MRDFKAEFKASLARIDKEAYPEVKVLSEKVKYKVESLKLYDIFKRSLPVGIDQKVVIGVTKNEAEWWIEKVLKPKAYQDDSTELKTLIYFEIIPQNATPRERNVYYNDGGITK